MDCGSSSSTSNSVKELACYFKKENFGDLEDVKNTTPEKKTVLLEHFQRIYNENPIHPEALKLKEEWGDDMDSIDTKCLSLQFFLSRDNGFSEEFSSKIATEYYSLYFGPFRNQK